jgi:2'-5' RNA ligase
MHITLKFLCDIDDKQLEFLNDELSAAEQAPGLSRCPGGAFPKGLP